MLKIKGRCNWIYLETWSGHRQLHVLDQCMVSTNIFITTEYIEHQIFNSNHLLSYLPFWEVLQRGWEEHAGDHLVQHDVTQGHEVYHDLVGLYGEEVRGHPMLVVQQKVLHLKYKYGTLVTLVIHSWYKWSSPHTHTHTHTHRSFTKAPQMAAFKLAIGLACASLKGAL